MGGGGGGGFLTVAYVIVFLICICFLLVFKGFKKDPEWGPEGGVHVLSTPVRTTEPCVPKVTASLTIKPYPEFNFRLVLVLINHNGIMLTTNKENL